MVILKNKDISLRLWPLFTYKEFASKNSGHYFTVTTQRPIAFIHPVLRGGRSLKWLQSW